MEVSVRGLGIGECFPLHFCGDDIHKDQAGDFELWGRGLVDGEAVRYACAAVVADEDDPPRLGRCLWDVEDGNQCFEDGGSDRTFGVLARGGEGGYAVPWQLGQD